MTKRPLTRANFAPLVPHTAAMLLIDEVLHWNERQILARCHSHQNPHHPLRLNGELSALHLIEYGAQTLAVHGGLLNGKAQPGFLAAVRAAHFYLDTLDGVTADLLIQANSELQGSSGAVYQVSIHDTNNRLLLEAGLTVVYRYISL